MGFLVRKPNVCYISFCGIQKVMLAGDLEKILQNEIPGGHLFFMKPIWMLYDLKDS